MAHHHVNTGSDPDGRWRETLSKGHSPVRGLRRVMRMLPGSPRCKVCHNPFGGFGGKLCGVFGMTPSRKNPQLCALCCEKLPAGGAETDTVVLFADVRGSTALSESMGPTAYAELLNNFYQTATSILLRHDATIDKLIGDEVMAFFIRGFSGPDYKRSAIDAGLDLLRGLGYGSTEGPWLPVGVGVESGIAFVGNVGGPGYVDFTVLGDPVNLAAHIQAAAGPGELLVGETAFTNLAGRYAGSHLRSIELKGKPGPAVAWSVPLAGAA
jgi:adenylate cyclase